MYYFNTKEDSIGKNYLGLIFAFANTLFGVFFHLFVAMIFMFIMVDLVHF